MECTNLSINCFASNIFLGNLFNLKALLLPPAESQGVGWLGCYINVWHREGLPMVLLHLKVSLELFLKRWDFRPGFRFLSHRDMT